MRTPFETERGDEFMSLVYALNAEAEGRDHAAAGAARTELEQILAGGFGQPVPLQPPDVAPVAHAVAVRPDVEFPAEPELEPVAVPAPLRIAPPPSPIRASVVSLPLQLEQRRAGPAASDSSFSVTAMVDELTGIGGPLALRRDLMLENSIPWPGGPRYSVVTIDVHPVAEVRASRGPEVADRLFRTLVEAVRASLGPSDAMYRSGPDELTLLVRGSDRGDGERARMALESSLRRALAERGLPKIRLAAERTDPLGVGLVAPEAAAI